MKIAITSSGLGHINRGIETWSKEVANSLNDVGIDVTLYKGAGKRESEIEKVIPCFRRCSKITMFLKKIMPPFAWRIGFGSEFQMEATTFTLNLIPELIVKQYDIIHTQEASSALILEYVRKAGFIRSKIILAYGAKASAEFLNRFETIQYLTPYDFYRFKTKIRNKKFFIIPNFVDIQKFSPSLTSLREEMDIKKEAFVILSVGMITDGKYKNMRLLIEEVFKFKKRVKREVYLIIAGATAKNTQEIINFGKELLKDNIIFLLNYSHNLMPKVYSTSDLFVLCSLEEMMPIALIEALSSGLSSICHKYPVMEWIIGGGGECIDMTKKRELSKTIEKYSDSGLREKISKKARERAVDAFSKEIIIKQTVKMYESVLNGSLGSDI